MNETVALVGVVAVLTKTLDKLVDFMLTKFRKVDHKDSVDTKIVGLNAKIDKIDPQIVELRSQLSNVHGVLKELSELMHRADVNGTPLIYFPRNIEARQLESINMLNDQAHSQENTIKILDKMADRIIEMSGTQDQILHEVRK